MRRAWLLTLCLGCDGTVDPASIVDTLQIVSIVAEPPAPLPGESQTLKVVMADPEQVQPDVWLWQCGLSGCTQGTTVWSDGSPVVRWPAPEGELLWGLACDPTWCPEAPTLEQMVNPLEGLTEIPLEQVSLVGRAVPIALPSGPEVVNPTVLSAPEVELGGTEPVELAFEVADAEWAWGYATSGGFLRNGVQLTKEGLALLEWVPPENPTSGEVFVVFDNEAGGSAVWSQVVP